MEGGDNKDNKDNKNDTVNSDDDDEGSEPSLKRPSLSRFPFTSTSTTSSATATHDRYFMYTNYTPYGKANSYYNKGNTAVTSMFTQKPPPPPEDKSPAEKYIPSVKKDGPWFEERAKYAHSFALFFLFFFGGRERN